jgi:hypothetical protein
MYRRKTEVQQLNNVFDIINLASGRSKIYLKIFLSLYTQNLGKEIELGKPGTGGSSL